MDSSIGKKIKVIFEYFVTLSLYRDRVTKEDSRF